MQSGTLTLSGVLGGTGVFYQNGVGTTIVNNSADTYTGPIHVNAGMLQIGDGTAGDLSGTTSISVAGAAILATDLADGATMPRAVMLGASTTALKAVQSGANTLSGVIGGNGAFEQNGTGTTILTGAETYTGPTFVNVGALQIGNGSAGNLAATTTVTVAANAKLTLQLAKAATFSSKVTDNGQLSTSGIMTDNYTVAGLISGIGSLTKDSGNVVTIIGANTFSGGTTLNTGTLLVKNTTGSATGSGAVAINTGATLGGSGTISGPVTLNDGGTVAPSSGTSGVAGTTLHGSSLTWNAGGSLTLELSPSKGDELALTGALTKGPGNGNYTLDLLDVGLSATATYSFTLATFASTDFAPSDFTLELPTNFTGTLVETSTSLKIINFKDPPPPSIGNTDAFVPLPTVESAITGSSTAERDASASLVAIAVPEPGSTALLSLGIGGILGWRRRRRE